MTTPTDTTEEEPMHAIVSLAQRQPMAALFGLLLLGGTGGTIGATFISPLVDDALDAHSGDERAHDIDRIEERLTRIETALAEQQETANETQAGIARALVILEAR